MYTTLRATRLFIIMPAFIRSIYKETLLYIIMPAFIRSIDMR